MLKIHERMLLDLLRAALNHTQVNVPLFEQATESDWQACYQLSIEQGVQALSWDGVTLLPSALLPPKKLKLKWALCVEACEKRYNRYCKTIHELSDFYAEHHISTLLLKGVGFSRYYPKPQHRECGDIDIFTYSSDSTLMSNEEANALSDKLMMNQHINVSFVSAKHSTFFYHQIPIENHKTFLDVHEWKIAGPVEERLRSIFQREEVSLLDDGRKVLVPGQEFNTLFIAFHAMQHYAAGLCLHHLCDWVCVLKRCGLHLPNGLDSHVVDFINTLTAFTNCFLGTNVQTNVQKEALEKMIYHMFRSPYRYQYQSKNPLAVMIYKTRYIFYYRNVIKELTGDFPNSKRVWATFKHVVHAPSLLIKIKK